LRCRICDKVLSPSEIKFNKDIKRWEDCAECLTVAVKLFGIENTYAYKGREDYEEATLEGK
jgi:transposase